jgi:hypothetical protein
LFFSEARDPTSKVNQAMKHELGNAVSIMDAFKRLGPASGKKVKKYIPQRLKEVCKILGSHTSNYECCHLLEYSTV